LISVLIRVHELPSTPWLSDQAKRRPRGTIRERGGVYQVRVYVGLDPVTSERVDLTGTASTEREAEKPSRQQR
jgi:hypothetical protein